MVPLAAEVLKHKGTYDSRRLIGVTSLDVSIAKSVVSAELETNKVEVPVIGGHAGKTSLPLLSKIRPSHYFTQKDIERLTIKIQDAISLTCMTIGPPSYICELQKAAAVDGFVRTLLRALDGEDNVFDFAFVASSVTELPFFTSRVRLGKTGVEAVIESDLHNLTMYEEIALKAVKNEVKDGIEKGIAFAAEGNGN